MATAGERLKENCPAARHGLRLGVSGRIYLLTEYDPLCQTCTVRDMLSEHDHLHLGGEVCEAEGLGGPGRMVKCSCGSYHH